MSKPCVYFPTTLASNVTLGSSVDVGGSWAYVSLEVPTMASGDLQIYGSANNVNYRPLHSVSSVTLFAIPSACTQRIVPTPAAGIRYLKVRNTSGCTDVLTTYNIICGD